jgi:outer membrane receptor protein involved in Fe transport
MQKILRFSLVAFLLVAMSALSVMAQSTVTGAISGVVSNPNKEVVPGAAVTVRNIETNKEQTATTDDEGRFRIVLLQPGTYAVTVNASGFSPFTQERVVVEVGQITPLDVPLSIGPVSGTVEVTSEAPVINTQQQDFSSNINQTSINELPSNGRRAANFVLAAPAVVPDGNFGLLSFRGISGLLNNSTVDGGDNNNAFYSEERGRTRISYVVSLGSIREFQVNTSNYSAEYGRAAGGVINTVTKSGTNEFHGGLFYYNRDNKRGATNPLTTRTDIINGTPTVVRFKPVNVRHQFGGNIGGPIVKNKAFFFFSYDEQKQNFPGAAIFGSPTFLNISTADRTALRNLNPTQVTDARIDQALSFLSSLTGEVPRRADQRIFFPKVDWNITPNNTFTAAYNRLRFASPAGIQTQPTTTRGRASFGDDFVQTDSLNLRLTSSISPTLLNEARFQWSRDNLFAFSQEPTELEKALATGKGGRPPQVAVGGSAGITFGKPDFAERVANPDERRWQYADTVTLSAGSHTFKFGGDVNRVNDLLDNLRNEGGSYVYSNANEFILDYLNVVTNGALRTAGVKCFNTSGSRATLTAGKCYTSDFQQAFGPTAFRIVTTDVNFFLQDDWRFSPRLTLNFGLRYEYEDLPAPQIPNNSPNLPTQTVGPVQTHFLPQDKNNIGPRFGFAYDLTGDTKTSLRGGYGLYYGRIINSTIINAISNTGVANSQRTFRFAANTSTSPVFPNVVAAAPATGGSVPSIVVFSSSMDAPQIHQADIILERQIAANTAVSVSYLFSAGQNLPTFVDTNLRPPVDHTFVFTGGGPLNGQTLVGPFFAAPRPDTRFDAITEIRSTIKSVYHALVLQANRRLTKGLQFQTSYTFSRARDNGQNSATFTETNSPPNPFDYRLEKGTISNVDIPHKFVASAVWSPGTPFGLGDSKVGRAIFGGFTFAPIITAISGSTYSANIASFTQTGAVTSGFTGIGVNRIPFIERNSFRQPKIVNVDLRVSRRFRFTETTNLEVLAEAFNLFNRFQVTETNFTTYRVASSTATTTNLTYDTTFGTVRSAGNSLVRERQVQLAVRFQF